MPTQPPVQWLARQETQRAVLRHFAHLELWPLSRATPRRLDCARASPVARASVCRRGGGSSLGLLSPQFWLALWAAPRAEQLQHAHLEPGPRSRANLPHDDPSAPPWSSLWPDASGAGVIEIADSASRTVAFGPSQRRAPCPVACSAGCAASFATAACSLGVWPLSRAIPHRARCR